MKWTSWLSLIGIAVIVALVVYSSVRVGSVRCEVCIAYRGREACRAVDGEDQEETRRAAVTNACALLASGVTETMACQRTPATKSECRTR